MPIYEFYCEDCHALFSFLARRTDDRRRPDCPSCGRARLERRASTFAVTSGHGDPQTGAEADDQADPGLEAALSRLAGEADSIDENDPRQLGGLMRRLLDATGTPVGEAMQEAMRRMESGEDPDAIETDLGDALEAEETAPGPGRLRALRRRALAPRIDRTLYEL